MNDINVGFCGGYDVYESGTPNEIKNFFNAINELALTNQNNLDWSLVLDRLYKRYVRFDDLYKTKEVIDFCKNILIKEGDSETDNEFLKYFRHFYSSLSSAISFHETFGEYRPIKIIVTDLPWCILEEKRPLNEYDQLNGEPFWSREYSAEEVERLSNL